MIYVYVVLVTLVLVDVYRPQLCKSIQAGIYLGYEYAFLGPLTFKFLVVQTDIDHLNDKDIKTSCPKHFRSPVFNRKIKYQDPDHHALLDFEHIGTRIQSVDPATSV